MDDLVGRPIFLALYPYFLKYGGVFKLCFGPKVFMVLSDPVVVREVLKEKPFSFSKGRAFPNHHVPPLRLPISRPTDTFLLLSKGVLAEILEPIMGQDTENAIPCSGKTGEGSSSRGSTRRGSTTWSACSEIAAFSSRRTSTRKSKKAAASRRLTWRNDFVP